MADIQQRLRSLGFALGGDPNARFGAATRSAIEAFQHRRGLRVDGVCGRQTWDVLVEAGYRLGDRFLYRRNPTLRGDDVAELQQRLSALGFDTGRVDGIFGDSTSQALGEFQRNAGLPVDGILGATTLRQLLRLQRRFETIELVSMVRARELLRQGPPTLSQRHVAIGEPGGLGSVVGALRRQLVAAGARVTSLHHPDGSAQAQEANAAGVDVYIGLQLDPDRPGCSTSYYSSYRYDSPGGKRLAEVVQGLVAGNLGVPDLGTQGMSVPVLRETRMPAVIVEVGPAAKAVEEGARWAGLLAEGLVQWARSAGD